MQRHPGSPRNQAADRRRAGLRLGALAAVTLATARLGVRCPVKAVLGIDCPGCGGSRAFLALMRGDLRRAASENAAAVVMGGVAVSYLIAPDLMREAAVMLQRTAARSTRMAWWADHPQASACVAAALWCAARNTRQLSFLRSSAR